jgi:conjugative transfer pilus assembly protein TraH
MISLELAQLMVYGMIEAVEQASRLKDQSYSGLLQTTISAARQEIQAESEELSGRYGSPQQMLAFYTNLMNASKAKSYGSFAQSPASQDSYPSN